MGRNCLFVRKGEKEKKKGLIKKFLSPSFLLCPTFSLSPNCLKSCDSHNLQSALQQTTTATAKRQGFPPYRRLRTLFASRGGVQTTCQKLQLCSFTPFLWHEGVWPGIIAHSASKSLAAAHSPGLRSVAARCSRRQTRTTGGEREIDRRSAPPTPRRDKFLFFHPERARRKGERKR